MSVFDTYIGARDSVLRNAERARAEQQQNALLGARQQQQQFENQMATDRLAFQQSEARREQQLSALGAVAQGLHDLPQAERWASFQSLAPRLSGFGIGQDMIAGITEADLTDANLATMMGLAGLEPRRSVFQNVGGGRIVEIAPDGSVSEAYAAPVDPLDRDLKQAQIDAQRALVGQRQTSASVARSREARQGRRGGSSGGGGGGGGGGSRAAAAPARKPWERF